MDKNEVFRNLQERYHRQLESMMEMDDGDLIAKSQHNLSENKVVFYQPKQEGAILVQENHSYDQVLRKLVNSAVREEKKQEIENRMNRSTLLYNFHLGKTEGKMEYQRNLPNGIINWVCTKYSLFEEPGTNHIMLFLYSYDMTDRIIDRQIVTKLSSMDYDAIGLLDVKTHQYMLRTILTQIEGPALIKKGDFDERVIDRLPLTLISENKESVIRQFQVAHIIEELETKKAFSIIYGIRDNEQQIRYKKMQFCYLDEDRTIVMYCRSDETDNYNKEQEQLHKTEEALKRERIANKAKTDFLSNMSHEIRTPMNAIIGMSKLAQDIPGNPTATKKYLHEIDKASEYLLGILNDVLDMRQIEKGKIDIHPTWVVPHDIFAACFPMFDEQRKMKKIQFHYQDIDRYRQVQYKLDFLRVQQIIMNLLNNAVKFTPIGGDIFMEYQNEILDERRCQDTYWLRDTGCGMSPEFLKKVFLPFEQEHNPLATQEQGTGLGLALVKNIIEAMGGTIEVESELGVGTTFKIKLEFEYRPLTKEQSQATKKASNVSLNGKKILLVDDHPLNREIARKVLESEHMIVDMAADGSEAVKCVEHSTENYYDAVLMDIRMPVMNGLDAARAIRKLPRGDAQTLPVIAMTANAYEEDVQAALEAGMNAHLAKPIEPKRLYATLREYIHE